MAVDQTHQGIVLVCGKGRLSRNLTVGANRRLVFVIDKSDPLSLHADRRLERAHAG